MTPTTSWASDWDAVLGSELHASHRATTSSRHPGQTFRGVVYSERPYVTCQACGGLRRNSTAPHSPRRLGDRIVDCTGREISP